MTVASEPSSPTSTSTVETALGVRGMDCASCVAHVERAAEKLAGVEACDVNLARGRAVVRFDPNRATVDDIVRAITSAGYPATPEDPTVHAADAEMHRMHHQHADATAWLRRAITAIVLWLPVELIH